jgi:hypothetical protein
MTARLGNPLRTAAFVTLVIGALVSLGLMARMGRHQSSLLLIVLFVIWDAAPFALLGLAIWWSRSRDARVEMAACAVSFAVSIGSVGTYLLDTFGPPHPRPAFMFVIVPPVSIVATVVALLTAHRLYNVK